MTQTTTLARETIFSDCRKYRYTLWREFPSELARVALQDQFVQFIGLNPSTATETANDNTIRRCMDYTQRWGYGAMCMTNLFPFRATEPEDMMAHIEENGIAHTNADWIAKIAPLAGLIVCAWGKDGKHLRRGQKVIDHLRGNMGLKLHHLGLNNDGTPKHPLYLKKTLTPILF